MEHLYIIDPTKEFNGQCLNTMPLVAPENINETKVHYRKQTFAEYNKEHGGCLVALTWEQFDKDFYQEYYKGLQEPFKETTEEQFQDMLEILPPKRWTGSEGKEYFFVGECYTANIYRCFVRLGDKYYTALRAITTPEENILNLKDVS
jgi:hypothetical protein